MKAVYKFAALTALAALLASCDKADNRNSSENSIRLWSAEVEQNDVTTRADETAFDRAYQPLFLFWTEGNFNNAGVDAPDFFVRIPEGEISNFQTDTYNTGVYYPLYDKPVKATGIAPAPGDGYLAFVTENDYSKFNIENVKSPYGDDDCGVTDVLSANVLTGSDTSPFVPSSPLLFKHLTTKVTFRAKLAESMTKYVMYVRVEFPGDLAAKTVEWNADAQAYELKPGVAGTDDYVYGNYWSEDGLFVALNARANRTNYYQVNRVEFASMGYSLIVPPGNGMDVIVRFKMADNQNDFDTNNKLRDVEVPVHIDFKDAGNDPVELKAGDAYTVDMTINVFDIEVVGRKVAWEDGGYVAIPIQIR